VKALTPLMPVSVMRTKDSPEQRSYLKQASDEGHLEPIFHGLDVLSSTPWCINRGVFDVALEAWNQGVAIAEIPASEANSVYDFPPKPSEEEDSDPFVRIRYYDSVRRVLTQQRKDHAERCKFNYTLEVARSFINETFYLPHNMDFRGRTYPIPPYLSPVGDDFNRGLLMFGEKKALGETGLKWLRIHLANVFGYDKMSFDERARFAEEHEKDIFDSADRPLEVSVVQSLRL
jgi:DNA-directed RNA polymerase